MKMFSRNQEISFWIRLGKGVYFMLLLFAYGILAKEDSFVATLVFLVLLLAYYWEMIKNE